MGDIARLGVGRYDEEGDARSRAVRIENRGSNVVVISAKLIPGNEDRGVISERGVVHNRIDRIGHKVLAIGQSEPGMVTIKNVGRNPGYVRQIALLSVRDELLGIADDVWRVRQALDVSRWGPN